MKVLGLSPLDKDSTVTLVEDGVITFAAAEERFTRVKLQDGFPWNALDSALKTTGTEIREIDKVVSPFLTSFSTTPKRARRARSSAPRGRGSRSVVRPCRA
jgi:predicted NodU family carbamoyl transferase